MTKITLLLCGTLVCTMAFAQMEATTKDGHTVILNNDGCWKFVEAMKEASPTVLGCADVIIDQTDIVTGNKTRSTKEGIIVSKDGKNGFGIHLFQGTGKALIFSATVVGAGPCIDDNNKMNVLFRDGTRIELLHEGDFNCEGSFTLYLGGAFGKKREMEYFMTREVKIMRIWTSKSYVEEELTSDNSKTLKKAFECLAVN